MKRKYMHNLQRLLNLVYFDIKIKVFALNVLYESQVIKTLNWAVIIALWGKGSCIEEYGRY